MQPALTSHSAQLTVYVARLYLDPLFCCHWIVHLKEDDTQSKDVNFLVVLHPQCQLLRSHVEPGSYLATVGLHLHWDRDWNVNTLKTHMSFESCTTTAG